MSTTASHTSPSATNSLTCINYQFDFTRYQQHLVDVTVSFIAEQDAPVLWLPSWLPGSYLMREFARHITAIHYHYNRQVDSQESNHYRANKLSKHEWQLTQVQANDKVSITYEVYCYDLSVRTAYVDAQRIFGNFSCLAVAIAGQETTHIDATLCIPTRFYQNKPSVKMACGLKHTHQQTDTAHLFTMQVANYDELIDYPFEVAHQNDFSFSTQDANGRQIAHHFFISGQHVCHYNRLQQDIQKICQTYHTWLEDTPFDDYTFMTFASGNDYGGLEHINSTALITPRNDLPNMAEAEEPSEGYQRYLGLCSHEYFHAWWVKTVRPDVMMAVDLRKEAYTPLLWVFEGFTSYIDDFMLQASGVVSKTSYLKLLTAQINRYQQTAGRHLQSVAESSFDAWIKLYRADENTGNAGISYYNKGALVALCLDLLLLQETTGKQRLVDVIKRFYSKAKASPNKRFGMTDDNLAAVISEFLGKHQWQAFYEKYIIGLDALPIHTLLTKNGIQVKAVEGVDNQQPWGMIVTETPQGLSINKVNRDSVASSAGLSAKDVIVAINGIKANKKQLSRVAQQQMQQADDQKYPSEQHNLQTPKQIVCHAFRRDELMTFTVPAHTHTNIPACQSLGKVVLSIQHTDIANVWLDVLQRDDFKVV